MQSEPEMLVQIGKRPETTNVVDLLLECHDRIRRFLAFARELVIAEDASLQEIRSLSAQVRRYFAESLPMHIADEQEQILPRLANRSRSLDQALAAMVDDHIAHDPLIARLIEICDRLVADPAQCARVSRALRPIVDELTTELLRHLELEEHVIFPAIRELSSSEHEAIWFAMRARRARAFA